MVKLKIDLINKAFIESKEKRVWREVGKDFRSFFIPVLSIILSLSLFMQKTGPLNIN